MRRRFPVMCIALGLVTALWGGFLLLRYLDDGWSVGSTDTTVMLIQVDDRMPWAAILTLAGGFALLLVGLVLRRRFSRSESSS